MKQTIKQFDTALFSMRITDKNDNNFNNFNNFNNNKEINNEQ